MFMSMPDSSGEIPSNVASVTSVADSFPVDALPPILAQMAEEVSEVALVPIALPACEALGIVSAALGRGLAIPSDRERKTFGNLYITPAAESGTGKSLTFRLMMAPVYSYQDEVRASAQAAKGKLKAEQFKIRASLRRVKSGELNMEDAELSHLIERLEHIEIELQKCPKIVCEDITQAKLQVLLAANNERIFSASADARQVMQAVMSGKGENPYLKAWSGDPTDVDRISRNSVPLREPRMAILWCPQPDLLINMFSKRALIESGFLPRVLPCLVDAEPMPISMTKRRVSKQTKADWDNIIRDLFANFHAKQGETPVLGVSTKAQGVLFDYYNSLIERRKVELADVGPFAARWAEQAWRLTVVLHAGINGKDASEKVVQSTTALNAIQIMDFFSQQQLNLLRQSRAHEKTEAQQAILDALMTRTEVTVRDVQLGSLRTLNAEAIRKVMDQLVAAGRLGSRVQKPSGGGHDKVIYYQARDNRDNRDSRQTLDPSHEA